MKHAIVLAVSILSAIAAASEDTPKPDAAQPGVEWGEALDGLRCRLEPEKTELWEGAEFALKFYLQFTRDDANRNVKFVDRYLDTRHVAVTFKNEDTGHIFERTPDDPHHGAPPDVTKEDITPVRRPFAPLATSVGLVSPEGEHIPPGDYTVTFSYRNDGQSEEVTLYKAGDVVYDGPWRFWKGTIVSAPVSLKVKRVSAPEESIKTNSALEARLMLNAIGWAWSDKKPKTIRVKTRPKYVLGKRYWIHVFLDGDEARYGGHGLTNSPWQEPDKAQKLTDRMTRRVRNGEKLKFRADIEIFETSVPAKTPWKPKGGDYRALWKGRIEGELPEEMRKTFTSIGNAL
jgi:hypothetical protein